jgi:Flp pilus assembly protein protease CpaA
LEWLWAPLLDGCVLALLVYRFGLTRATVADGALVLVLVQVLVFDARHRLILNKVIYPAIVAALVLAPISPLLGGDNAGGRIASALIGGAIGGGVFYALVLVSRGGIGLGDAKLTLFLTRARRFGDYIAYGPFLCVGGIAALLFPCGLFGPASCG